MDGTIFSDPFAPPGAPAPELLRNGRYHLPPVGDPTGKPISRQRVTNFVKAVSDTYALDQWKLRRVVVGLSRREDLYDLARGTAADDKATLGSIVDQALEAAKVFEEGGADTGTAFHAYTDQVDRGQRHTARAKWAPKLENYTRAMRAHGLEVVPAMMERKVVIERFNLGGTLDRILRSTRTGELFIGDLKSQKSFYTWWEIALQLALYSEADAMWNPDTFSYEEMPRVSRDLALVAWMPVVHPGADRDAVTFYDVDLTEARPCLDLVSNVLAMRKAGTRWGRPRALPVEQAAPIHDEEAYARYLRDAGTTREVEQIAHEATQRGVFSDMLRAIAATRWEQLDRQANMHAAQVEARALMPHGTTPLEKAAEAFLEAAEKAGVPSGAVITIPEPGREEVARALAMQDDASASAAMHDGAAELARAQHAVATHYLRAVGEQSPNLHLPPNGAEHEPGFVVNGRPADHVRAMTFSGPIEPVDPFRQPYDSARGWSVFPGNAPDPSAFAQPDGGSASFGAPDLRGVVERMSVTDVRDLLNTPGATFTTPPDLRAFVEKGATGAPEVVKALAESVRHVPVLTPPDPPEGDPSPEAVGTAEDQGADIDTAPDPVALATERARLAGVPESTLDEVLKRARNSATPRGRTRLTNDMGRKYTQWGDHLRPLLEAVWSADAQADAQLRTEMRATKEAVQGDDARRSALVDQVARAADAVVAADAVTDHSEAAARADFAEVFGQPTESTPALDHGAAVEDFRADRDATMRSEYGPAALAAITDVEQLVSMGLSARVRAERTAIIAEVGRRHAWTEDINRRLIIEHPGFPGDVDYTGPVADLSGAKVVEVMPGPAASTPPPPESGIEARPIETLSAVPALVLNPQRAVALEQVKDALTEAGSTGEIQRIWGEAARQGAWTEELEAHALACMRKAPR